MKSERIYSGSLTLLFLAQVRRLKEKLRQATQRAESFTKPVPSNVKQSDVFLTQLNALSTPRNVRTRRLAQAEDNPELARNARLACVLRDLYNAVVTAKGLFFDREIRNDSQLPVMKRFTYASVTS